MSKSFNQVTIMGNLTRDPELRKTPAGSDVCNLTVALNRNYKVKDEWKESTDYIDVVVWGALAERVSQYLTKGRPVLITGRLQGRNFEYNGEKRTKVEIVAQDVIFLGGKVEHIDYETKEKKEVVLKDIDDEININDIPF